MSSVYYPASSWKKEVLFLLVVAAQVKVDFFWGLESLSGLHRFHFWETAIFVEFILFYLYLFIYSNSHKFFIKPALFLHQTYLNSSSNLFCFFCKLILNLLLSLFCSFIKPISILYQTYRKSSSNLFWFFIKSFSVLHQTYLKVEMYQ